MAWTFLIAAPAKAQTTDIFMRDGSTTIERSSGTINFYDSHGPSRAHNYWEGWYNHGEGFTYIFKPQNPDDKIKVTFNLFTAYRDPTTADTDEYAQMLADGNNYDGVSIGGWALHLNDDELSVYQGEGRSDETLIATYTGNTKQPFSIMSNGAITFYFNANTSYREEGWAATVELV